MADVTERLAIAMLDSKSWLEVWPDESGYRVEYHCPTREVGVGYVDEPEARDAVSRGPRLSFLVTAVLVDTSHDAAAATRILERKLAERTAA